MTFLTILLVMKILCSFILVVEEKKGKEISESSRLKFLEKFSANNFLLMRSFVLLAYASLSASRTLL